jgi:hypothetical protein
MILVYIFSNINLTPFGSDYQSNFIILKEEFIQKLNVNVQNYNISTETYFSYGSHDMRRNQTISVINGNISDSFEEYYFQSSSGPSVNCIKKIKDGIVEEFYCFFDKFRNETFDCSSNNKSGNCDIFSYTDAIRKSELLSLNLSKTITKIERFYTNHIDNNRKCYKVFIEFTDVYINGYHTDKPGYHIFCFNEQGLIVNMKAGNIGFYVEGYPKI